MLYFIYVGYIGAIYLGAKGKRCLTILKSHDDEKLSEPKGKYMKTYLQKYLLKLKIKGKGRYTKEKFYKTK